jgi:predicted RNA binding protein YcfA (HicA-like mRNA interferase family)
MGTVYSSRELIALVEADGWYWFETTGSHHHYKHPKKSGKVTIPHPEKLVPKGTAASVFRKAQIKRT